MEDLFKFGEKKQKEKRYNRQKKPDIIDHKYYKCGYPECQKSFHDYSSLYTHIKSTHDGNIHPDTVSKPPKKSELLEWMKQEKGSIIQDPSFCIEIEDFVVYFFEQLELLRTYLIFQALLPQDFKFSTYFHSEGEQRLDLGKKYLNGIFAL